MAKLWFTSDLHIGHENVISFCNRPYRSLREMHRDIVVRWNAVVAPGDIGYFLGDIFMGNPKQYLGLIQAMNGYKVCVRGNHDPTNAKLLAAGFHRIHEQDFVLFGDVLFWLAHIPTHNESDKRLVRPTASITGWDIALCGHVHDKWRVSESLNVNVGVDVWGMDPVSPQQIIASWNEAQRA